MEKDKYILNGNQNRKVEDYYDVTETVVRVKRKVLGKGTYGIVFLATVKGSATTRAIKVIQKEKVTNLERFKNEVEIMKVLVSGA
jgi:D-Tyr-tRNAtyr deacylase